MFYETLLLGLTLWSSAFSSCVYRMKKLLSGQGRKKVIFVNLNVFFVITKTTLSSMAEIVIWNIGS